jgi:glycerate dehydrogenase
VADIGRAFGMKDLFSDYKGTKGMAPLYTPFEEVLEVSDIITLHSPLMPSTRNMISTAEFAQMARRPLLINTARGGLFDEAALEHALRTGQISGAGFDVVTTEPPAHDHPLMRLLDLPNFILTPHVAWASREAVHSLVDQLIDNVEAFERGEPTNIVAACRNYGSGPSQENRTVSVPIVGFPRFLSGLCRPHRAAWWYQIHDMRSGGNDGRI